MSDGVWGKHPIKNSTPETVGTRCNLCKHLECEEQKGARIHKWLYYCNALRKRYKYKELCAITIEECPEHRPIKRRFK